VSTQHTQVAVIGGGLAAHCAAAAARQAGLEVTMVFPPSPGATALWGGLGQAYGPATPFLHRATGLVGQRRASPRPLYLDRQRRFEMLRERREFHPYFRLGLSRKQVAAHLNTALESLDYPGLCPVPTPRVFASASAAPYVADLGARSVLASAVDRGDTVGVVDCPAIAGWRAERLVETLGRVEAVDAHVVDIALFSELPGRNEHSVKVATRLRNALPDPAEALAEQLADSVEQLGLDLLVLPPCVGATWPEHREIFDVLDAAVPCRVAESAAGQNAIHGWRLDRFLRALTAETTLSVRVLDVTIEDGKLTGIATDSETVEASAYVLATGRWVGGGLPSQPPLREALFGLDLWLDGAPIPRPDEVWTPNLLAEHVWADHPLFRAGLATDDSLRPLDRRGQPVADNLFAAGRILAGTNSFADGTALGVDLISGLLAGRGAADACAGQPARQEVGS
jgi:glycerol-3-phosphate dehydrogenase subunit B